MNTNHPSPFSYQNKDEIDENIIGWFTITFNSDINHEYLFTVYKDRRIIPDYDFEEDVPTDLDLFFKYLQDKELHSVIFTQVNGKDMNYKW